MVSVEVVECPQSPVVTGVFPEKLHRCLIVSVPMNYSNYRNDRIRTCDPMLPRQVLYQAELHSGFHFVKSSCIFRSSAGGLHIHLLDGRGRIICFGSNSLTSRLIWFSELYMKSCLNGFRQILNYSAVIIVLCLHYLQGDLNPPRPRDYARVQLPALDGDSAFPFKFSWGWRGSDPRPID